MNPANRLEDALFKNTKKALGAYRKMTGVGRPYHVPESFVQMFLALNVSKSLGIRVLPEATKRKIEEVLGRPAKGRVPSYFKARYDLAIFFNSARLWAAVELKRANSLAPLQADKKKLRRFLSAATGKSARRGYLLAFTGAKPRTGERRVARSKESVRDRIKNWASALDASLVGSLVTFSREDDRTVGIALYRLRRKRKA
jgi:hypothetical protein